MADKYDSFLDSDSSDAKYDTFLDSKDEVKKSSFNYENALRKSANEMPWLQRNIAATVTPYINAYQASREMTGYGQPDKMLEAKVLQEEAPIGSFFGSLAPVIGAAGKIPVAASWLGRAIQGAGFGAASGMLTPTGKEQASVMDKGAQVASGASLGAAIPIALDTGGVLYRGARNVIMPAISNESAKLSAARLANKVAGKDVNQIIDLIRNGDIDETAVQAAVKSGNPEFMALFDIIKTKMGKEFDQIMLAQKAKSTSVLNTLARGSTAERSMESRDIMREQLKNALMPKGEKAIMDANASGMINTSAITNKISTLANSPKYAGNTNASTALGKVDVLIKDWEQRGGGVIDADALWGIRKNAINQTVNDLLKGQDPIAAKRVAAKLESEIRPYIDDAIENAGGTGWKSFITKYHKGLAAVDRIELLDVARDLYRTNPDKFVDLVKGESPEIVQRIMSGKANMNDVLSKNTITKLEEVASQAMRDKEVSRLSSVGIKQARNIVGESENPIPKIGLLNRVATITNSAINLLEGKGGERIDKELARLMLPQNKKEFAELMNAAQPNQRAIIMKAIASRGLSVTAGSMGAQQ